MLNYNLQQPHSYTAYRLQETQLYIDNPPTAASQHKGASGSSRIQNSNDAILKIIFTKKKSIMIKSTSTITQNSNLAMFR